MNQQIKHLIGEARKLSPDEQAELLDKLLIELHQPTVGWKQSWAAGADPGGKCISLVAEPRTMLTRSWRMRESGW